MVENIGMAVRFRITPSGALLDGWYVGEIGSRVYIALDEDGATIVQVRRHYDFSYPCGRPLASFATSGLGEALKEADEIEDALEPPMRQAMDRLDYNRLRSIVQATRSAFDAVDCLRHLHGPLSESGAREIGSVLDAHEALLGEVDRSGILKIIAEYGERILRVSCSELHLFGPGINDEWKNSGAAHKTRLYGSEWQGIIRPAARDHAAAKAALAQLRCSDSRTQSWPCLDVMSDSFLEMRMSGASASNRLLRGVQTTAKHLALGALGDPTDLLVGRLPELTYPFLTILSGTCVGLLGAAEAVADLRRLSG